MSEIEKLNGEELEELVAKILKYAFLNRGLPEILDLLKEKLESDQIGVKFGYTLIVRDPIKVGIDDMIKDKTDEYRIQNFERIMFDILSDKLSDHGYKSEEILLDIRQFINRYYLSRQKLIDWMRDNIKIGMNTSQMARFIVDMNLPELNSLNK